MKIINLAGIKIGFWAQFEIQSDEKMNLFLEKEPKMGLQGCDYLFQVSSEELPEFPDDEKIFENERMCVCHAGQGELIFYREPNRGWDFCLEKDMNGSKIYVIPKHVRYAKNIWNLMNKIELSSLMLKKGAVILHASFIIWEGKAILFSAPSGTGKTTQAELWQSVLQAEIINGDRAVLRIEEGCLWAFGLPFDGSSGICQNRKAPVLGIAVLEQAERNYVQRLPQPEAVKWLYSQAALERWRCEDINHMFRLLESFTNQVAVVKLSCLPDKDAVYMLKAFLEEDGK